MTKEQTLGQRMRRAANRRRIGAYKIGKAVGVYAQTVYDWWHDKYKPEPARLRAYAEFLGATMAEVSGEKSVADILAEILNRVGRGEDPRAAYLAVTGEAREWSEAQSAGFAAGAPALRDYLNQIAGGDWAALPPEEQQQLLDQVMAAPPGDGQTP